MAPIKETVVFQQSSSMTKQWQEKYLLWTRQSHANKYAELYSDIIKMNTFAYIGFQQVNYSMYYAPYSLSKATALILVKQNVMSLLKRNENSWTKIRHVFLDQLLSINF